MRLILVIAFALSSAITSFATHMTDALMPNITVSEPMYYIHIIESKSDRELFPKLYPIGFVIKEKNPGTDKIMYLLGEFATETEANEALSEVKASGYSKAYIVQRG